MFIMLYYIILFYINLYCIISYYIMLYYIILYYITLYYIILHYIILYYVILYYIILYCIISYYIMLYYIDLLWKIKFTGKLPYKKPSFSDEGKPSRCPRPLGKPCKFLLSIVLKHQENLSPFLTFVFPNSYTDIACCPTKRRTD